MRARRGASDWRKVIDMATSNGKQQNGQERKRLMALSFAALGIVFGDIATSPIYAIRECFHGEYGIPVITHCCLEPHGQVCDFRDGELNIWPSTQAVTQFADGLGQEIGVDQSK